MEKTPLAPGQLEEIVRETFNRSGIEDIAPNTPAALFVLVSKWDRLLTPVEIAGLRMLVKALTPAPKWVGE